VPHGVRRVAALLALCACSRSADMPSPAPNGSSAAPAASAPLPEAKVSPSAADTAFDQSAARFLADFLRLEPVRATELGNHDNDGRWPDVTAAGEASFRRFIESTRAALAAIREEELSVERRIDRRILATQLDAWTFGLDELRPTEQNPLYYTGLLGDGIDPLVTRSFAPVEQRMISLRSRLEGLPAVVAAAKQRLKEPPRIHTETAIEQNRGLVSLCDKGLAPHWATLPEAERKNLETAARTATAALRDFQTFLEKELLPRSNASFRLGRARFEKKLRFALEDEVDADAVARGARALLSATFEEMVETSRELWPTVLKGPAPATTTPDQKRALVKKVLDRIAEDRPDNATIVDEARRTLADATRFVRDRDLVRLPEEPCDVIEMPEYRRGVAIAYCDASGPLEKKQETFYAIAPTPKDWSKQRVTSFYREYNRSMLIELTVHEAMPGHFLQIMHSNRFDSDVRAVFSSGPFVEGWAVYAEWLMAKHGFGGPKVRLMRQKMVLRLSCNAILDHGVHAGTLDEKEALSLMTQDGFQEEGEAVGKWKRARLTSAQLTTYYYGFTEMLALRRAAEAAPGFRERDFHDRVLSHGSPAMRHLRELIE
jgi:uncharacterized protein (DUF885 family)